MYNLIKRFYLHLQILSLDVLENYVNLPLSLMINELILTVLFILAGVRVLVSLCSGAAKIGGIFAGVSSTLQILTSIYDIKRTFNTELLFHLSRFLEL